MPRWWFDVDFFYRQWKLIHWSISSWTMDRPHFDNWFFSIIRYFWYKSNSPENIKYCEKNSIWRKFCQKKSWIKFKWSYPLSPTHFLHKINLWQDFEQNISSSLAKMKKQFKENISCVPWWDQSHQTWLYEISKPCHPSHNTLTLGMGRSGGHW